MTIQDLPALNAALNATSGCLLAAGYYFIKRKRIVPHRACMIAALAVSSLFLVSYLVYHAHVGSKPFPGHGPIRVLYFTILITHVILAAVIVPYGARHGATRLAHGRRAAPAHRAMDVAAVDVRLGDGSGDLRDVVQTVLGRTKVRPYVRLLQV